MTFEQLVEAKRDWIGGILESEEGEYAGYNDKITDIKIENGIFNVLVGSGGVGVSMKDSSVRVTNDRIVSFRIPYVGYATLYKKVVSVANDAAVV